jgi:CRP-like cAMP-binding protein
MDFFIIESGSVKVTSSDRTVVYTTLGPGDYLGESCLLGRQLVKRSASAHSSGYTSAYSLRNVDFAQVRNLTAIIITLYICRYIAIISECAH